MKRVGTLLLDILLYYPSCPDCTTFSWSFFVCTWILKYPHPIHSLFSITPFCFSFVLVIAIVVEERNVRSLDELG